MENGGEGSASSKSSKMSLQRGLRNFRMDKTEATKGQGMPDCLQIFISIQTYGRSHCGVRIVTGHLLWYVSVGI